MGVNPRGIAMLPAQGSTAMRLLSKRQLKELVLYCPQHIQRLENANQFPKRVRLGNGPRSRVGWIESEVMDWLQKRIAAREQPTDISE
jgi:prophage regulatory protein